MTTESIQHFWVQSINFMGRNKSLFLLIETCVSKLQQSKAVEIQLLIKKSF